MSTDVFLASLIEYINVKQELSVGQAEEHDLKRAKKNFGTALNEYIDWRVKAALEERRSHLSTEMVAVANTINSTVKDGALSVRAMAALNSAPNPPSNDDADSLRKWTETYRKWYEETRKKGLTIG